MTKNFNTFTGCMMWEMGCQVQADADIRNFILRILFFQNIQSQRKCISRYLLQKCEVVFSQSLAYFLK